MKQFYIQGEFPAENIDDAFQRLSEYFRFLSEGEDGDVFGMYPHKFDIGEVKS